ncbi:glycerophosphoryl diester phosphodiesterase membrane domain-containing protein [Hathewaya massiliensis]|uniref:glycerophosphoryl diester phosphodiesterase membrane domain-containing protein n=1 Tax=Hathewaya massiliensis TaxID=1964382 RepID=UPI001158CC4B|nr:glycerophosphodiester phosphodiesterase [Hathewaya massiliensis]
MYSFRKLFKDTFKDFKKSFHLNIKFEAIYKVLTSFFLIPFMSICLNYFISLSGRKIITNNELIKFSTSLPGIAAFIVLLIICGISIILEIGTLIIIANNIYFKHKISLKEAFILAVNNVSKLFSLGSLRVILYIIFLVPLLGIGITSSLNTELKIPSFIVDWFFENPTYLILLILLIILAYFFLIRWIFSLHIAIIENKNFKSALKESKKLCKGRYKYILKNLILFQLTLSLIGLAVLVFLTIILDFIFKRTGINNFSSLSLLSLYSVVVSILFLLFSLFISPLYTILITRLYYSLKPSYVKKEFLGLYKRETNINLTFRKVKNNKKIVQFLIIIILSISVIFGTLFFYSESEKNHIEITAHRGNSSEAPENTLSSIEYAIKAKADYAEIDVQETKDGEVVLTHDSNLKRTLGLNKYIWEISLNELQQYNIKSNFDYEFEKEKIPTLEEVMKKSKGKLKLNIELKTNGHETKLIGKVVTLVQKYSLEKDVVITSLDYDALKEVKNRNPKIKVGYIMYLALGDLGQLKVDFYSIESSNVSKSLVKKAHLIGREVHVWTVDDPTKMEELMDMSVDNIITNKPREMKEALEDKKILGIKLNST